MLKESDDLDILGVTFDSKLAFEKHLRSVFVSTKTVDTKRSILYLKTLYLEEVLASIP